jgi:hypothetical protein
VSNVINPYDPIWYAQEALIQLEKALGLAARVHRGYDKTTQQQGSTIQITKPGTFTAQDAPSSAQGLNPSSVSIVLDKWKEVKFSLTDKELAYTGEKIINDHIRPAAYAIADQIDSDLNAAMWKGIPYYTDVTLSSASIADILAARRVLFNNAVPMNDLHAEIDGYLEEKLLGLQAFSQYQGGGDAAVNTQLRGTLGTKFGVEFFANQNVPSVTSTNIADLTGAASGIQAAGATSVAIISLTATAAIKAGDVLTISGRTDQYSIAADVTASGGAATLTLTSPLLAAIPDTTVLVIVQASGAGGATRTQNMMFHRNVAALAMAPLPTIASQLGAKVESIPDPATGLAIRSRLFYDGNASAVYVALDVLYGVKVLDGTLGVRMRAA